MMHLTNAPPGKEGWSIRTINKLGCKHSHIFVELNMSRTIPNPMQIGLGLLWKGTAITLQIRWIVSFFQLGTECRHLTLYPNTFNAKLDFIQSVCRTPSQSLQNYSACLIRNSVCSWKLLVLLSFVCLDKAWLTYLWPSVAVVHSRKRTDDWIWVGGKYQN